MIPLIKINLLPYREAIVQKQKQHLKQILLLGLVAGLGLSALAYFTLDSRLSSQTDRNLVLKNGIKQLDEQIVQVKELEKEKEEFFRRKQKVEELESLRFEGARIVDTLNTIVPDGLVLSSITSSDKTGLTYTIDGKAISDSKIAMFMRAIPASGLFGTPELLSIKKNNDVQEFKLSVGILRATQDTAQKASETTKKN
ncbi:PilN domain-containing protein [Stenoxybacter acetivorans]|uniref:PilN domain-containing protein n=1 Tax=Stenoxybacter acetivorans TaxID=422441 RepID=UPI00056AB2CA|nr:PilN domain-containing protein [Stenoxybacter acetivorans]